MKTFPDIDQDSIAYADELARHIDDPDHLAIFEVLWSGTRQYQRVIEREGLPAIQRLLASVSRNITEAEKRFPELAAIEAKAAAVIAATPEDLKRLAEPDFRRDAVTRRLVQIDTSERITARIKEGTTAERRLRAARSEADALQANLAGLRAAEPRLRAAIIAYVVERNHGDMRKADAEPVQVVVAPDSQFRVVVDSLPARQTVSEVTRDSQGQIVSTVQTEVDLVASK
ncbi:MAG: hypothetical protein IT510_02835 [Sulfuritalea sp.]|nr:hypothetical protein [Sulfuritalea sp.]